MKKTNVLVLITNTNNVSNYVSTKYLLLDNREDEEYLPKPDKILVVHSNSTKKYAIAFRKLLCQTGENRNLFDFVSLGDEDNDYKIVEKQIQSALKKINFIGKLHLHTAELTPNTIYCKQAIDRFTSENGGKHYYGIRRYFSEYNSKKDLICIKDHKERFAGPCWFPFGPPRLSDVIKLDIATVLYLHCTECKGKGSTESIICNAIEGIDDSRISYLSNLTLLKWYSRKSIYGFVDADGNTSSSSPSSIQFTQDIILKARNKLYFVTYVEDEDEDAVKLAALESHFHAERIGVEGVIMVVSSSIWLPDMENLFDLKWNKVFFIKEEQNIASKIERIVL